MDIRVVEIVPGIVVATARGAFAQGTPPQPGRPPRWGQQAEKEFRLGRGLAPKLMTEEEWKEHREKVRSADAGGA